MNQADAQVSTSNIPQTLIWKNHQLKILDQRKLPQQTEYIEAKDIEQVWQAIKTLSVRGAPAIGICAAYGLALSMRDIETSKFSATLKQNAAYLKSARPTAVNLSWAVDLTAQGKNYTQLADIAESIHAQDRLICQSIGKQGAHLITPNCNVLTHCNAGALAVSELGTATAPMYHQHADNVPFHVYVDETRPLLQGARLTAWELDASGIATTLICDNMAATLMAQKKVDLVLVGTDRVTANGDVINKIGTLGVAVLAKHYGIPFYVACPSSTYDALTPSGNEVKIEEREPEEVWGQHAAKVPVYNPAFDITPANLVTGIITEFGIAYSAQQLKDHVGVGLQ